MHKARAAKKALKEMENHEKNYKKEFLKALVDQHATKLDSLRKRFEAEEQALRVRSTHLRYISYQTYKRK